MDEKKKAWIDSASYEDLLRRWRNEPIGTGWFEGDIGEYYMKAMAKARALATPEEAVQASKNVGWGRE